MVYTEEEAKANGISFSEDWRSAEVGRWVQTDTGFIVQVLDKGIAGETPWVRTASGTFPSRGHDNLSHEPRQNRYNFSGAKPGWAVTKSVEDFARTYARTRDPVGAFILAFPNARSARYIRTKGQQYLNLPAVQNIVKKERELMLSSMGIDRKMIYTKMKTMLEELSTSERIDARALEFRILKFFDDTLDRVVGDVSTTIERTDIFELSGTALEAAEHGIDHQTRIKQKTKVRVDGKVDVEGMTGGPIEADVEGRDSREVFPG